MSTLPTGTVTFVFTDIEGSTRLLQELGDAYAEVTRDHRRIVREAFGGNGGQEIDTQGDAFFYSFPRARDAVGAAVEAQRRLADHPWPGESTVLVRMGLHTGEPCSRRRGVSGSRRRPSIPHLWGRPRGADPAVRDDPLADRERPTGRRERRRPRRGEAQGHSARAALRAVARRHTLVPPTAGPSGRRTSTNGWRTGSSSSSNDSWRRHSRAKRSTPGR